MTLSLQNQGRTPASKMRVVVLISPDYAATYFANMLMKQVNVVGVFVEKQHRTLSLPEKIGKAFRMAATPWKTLRKFKENKIFNHYNRKICGEIDLREFGSDCEKLIPRENCKIIYTEGQKKINEQKYVDQMRSLNPDIIAICGTSIVNDDIIKIPSRGVLNLHTGLPQGYRGVSTVQWAIYNEEPEFVGSTVHFVDSGIDTGRIIYQGRPDIYADDDPEALNVKAVKIGVRMMVKAINDIENGTIVSYEQKNFGKLYLERMFTASIIEEVWEKYRDGVIRDYVKNKKLRDKKVIEMMVGIYSESS